MTGYIWGLFLGIVWKTSKFSKRSGSWFIQWAKPDSCLRLLASSLDADRALEAVILRRPTSQFAIWHIIFGRRRIFRIRSYVSFLPFKVKSDDHCRLEAVDSSVAGFSNNMSENIAFKPKDDCESLPQNDIARVTLPNLKPVFEDP